MPGDTNRARKLREELSERLWRLQSAGTLNVRINQKLSERRAVEPAYVRLVDHLMPSLDQALRDAWQAGYKDGLKDGENAAISGGRDGDR